VNKVLDNAVVVDGTGTVDYAVISYHYVRLDH
jgi:hypothetical protein